MKTKTLNVYSFDELNDEAKQNAIEHFRNNEDHSFIADEATDTLNKFCDIFNIKWYSFDYCEMYRSEWKFNIEENVLELSGQRLATYLWNNFRRELFKGKYYNSWTSTKKIFHKKVESTLKSKATGWSDKSQYGEYWNVYHGLKLEHSCVLTGVCYDEDILAPIYQFIDKPNSRIDFETLLQDCLHSLAHSVSSEIEYQSKDECIIDMIEANEYEFDEDGELC